MRGEEQKVPGKEILDSGIQPDDQEHQPTETGATISDCTEAESSLVSDQDLNLQTGWALNGEILAVGLQSCDKDHQISDKSTNVKNEELAKSSLGSDSDSDLQSGWFIRHHDGVNHGPYSLPSLIKAAAQGNIANDTYVMHQTDTKGAWVLGQKLEVLTAAMNNNRDSSTQRNDTSSKTPYSVNTQTKTCPYCAEVIAIAAIKCKHCGEMLSTKKTLRQGRKKRSFFTLKTVFALAFLGLALFAPLSLLLHKNGIVELPVADFAADWISIEQQNSAGSDRVGKSSDRPNSETSESPQPPPTLSITFPVGTFHNELLKTWIVAEMGSESVGEELYGLLKVSVGEYGEWKTDNISYGPMNAQEVADLHDYLTSVREEFMSLKTTRAYQQKLPQYMIGNNRLSASLESHWGGERSGTLVFSDQYALNKAAILFKDSQSMTKPENLEKVIALVSKLKNSMIVETERVEKRSNIGISETSSTGYDEWRLIVEKSESVAAKNFYQTNVMLLDPSYLNESTGVWSQVYHQRNMFEFSRQGTKTLSFLDHQYDPESGTAALRYRYSELSFVANPAFDEYRLRQSHNAVAQLMNMGRHAEAMIQLQFDQLSRDMFKSVNETKTDISLHFHFEDRWLFDRGLLNESTVTNPTQREMDFINILISKDRQF